MGGRMRYDRQLQPRERHLRRWLGRVDKTEEGCWLWTGSTTRGYGRATFGEDGACRHIYIHRAMYEWLKGPVPEGLELDHLCRVRHCCNPDHLEPVTGKENSRRGLHAGGGVANARKTHCKRGHEFTLENTYVHTNGYRQCRACVSEQHRRTYAARKALAGSSPESEAER